MPLNPLFQSGPLDPDGTPQVSPEPTTLLLDDFGAVALTTNWTLGGTSPTISGGAATFPVGTTASATSYMRTTGAFRLPGGSFLLFAHLVTIETSPLVNNCRWWGYGSNAATPTSAAPVTNGAVFILDPSDGVLKAATYSAGTRTNLITLTGAPTRDAATHRYEIRYRQSIVYWLIDGITVAQLKFPNLAIANMLNGIIGSANASTAPSSAPTFSLVSFSASDLAANAHPIADGAAPWLQATVKAGSTAAATADSPLVVALHPSSPTPALAAGTSLVGAVAVGATAQSASYYSSTTTNAATVAKTSAGSVQGLVISNGSTSVQWVKLYNATSVTLGTTAAVIDIQVAAGATFSLATGPNGIRFTTGIAYAVTGATGATNNTAGAGSVLIALTYV